MNESMIVAFRSRQAVLRFEALCREAGLKPELTATPLSIARGCSIAVRLPLASLQEAKRIQQDNSVPTLIGFYHLTPSGVLRI